MTTSSIHSRHHWPEYVIEATGLGFFMISAGLLGTLLQYPASPVLQMVPNPVVRRCVMAVAMALTAVTIVYSPWGKRSGAHINPATTLTFWMLGKVAAKDALFYILSQFLGGLMGVAIVAGSLGDAFVAPPVSAVATRPGDCGPIVAFVAELAIAFMTMTVVLWVSCSPRTARFTGIYVGLLIFLYILIEAPLSGCSMNPARSFASAAISQNWEAIWIYLTAPFLGMLTAAACYIMVQGPAGVRCAKLHHDNPTRCIFCEYQKTKGYLQADEA